MRRPDEWRSGTFTSQFDRDDAIRQVAVPVLAFVTLLTTSVAAAKFCCGISYRRFDPYRVGPVVMAAITSGLALYTYFRPSPETPWSRG